jgi:hypothetical protein
MGWRARFQTSSPFWRPKRVSRRIEYGAHGAPPIAVPGIGLIKLGRLIAQYGLTNFDIVGLSSCISFHAKTRQNPIESTRAPVLSPPAGPLLVLFACGPLSPIYLGRADYKCFFQGSWTRRVAN